MDCIQEPERKENISQGKRYYERQIMFLGFFVFVLFLLILLRFAHLTIGLFILAGSHVLMYNLHYTLYCIICPLPTICVESLYFS